MSREMKDSGIAWIGEIPEHWGIGRMKDMVCLYTGNSIKDEDKDSYTDKLNAYPYVSTKDVDSVYYTINYDNGLYIPKDDLQFKIADIGSSLVCIEGGSAGKKKAFVEQKISFVNKLCCFAPKGINGKYLFYYLCSPNFEIEFNKFVSGLIGGVSVSLLKNFAMILPSISEQQKIAEFLDRKCGEIDELVALQEKMIEELKAYKQSVITEAVTKGLNPNAPMKDSGIEWIGEIPRHWEVCRVRNVGITQNGISKGGEFFGEGEPFVTYSDVYKNMVLPKTAMGLILSTKEEQDKFSVKKGDVFFTRTSETIEEIGISSICEQTISNAVFAGFLIRLRLFSDKLLIYFAKYYFRSNIHRTYFVREMNIVTRASLSQDLLKSLIILLPSLTEQQAIADYLDRKCAEIDELVGVKQQKIETLKEYKKSLIYEYVTGKKEVI